MVKGNFYVVAISFSKRKPEIKAFKIIFFFIIGLISQYSSRWCKSLMMSARRSKSITNKTIINEALMIICTHHEILPFKLWYPNGRSRISMYPQPPINTDNLDIALLLMTVR
ncbi:hypothetical protein Scep_008795 [Stephania cephalantha]|uniref:Uncharacterized protein n=1 Tax=Stephania cephalantha TaxID=152367 RepID=A0AAP0JSN2_9MAGN